MEDLDRSSLFYEKTLGSLMGGLIGDAMGTPTEAMHYTDIEKKYGWIDDFDCDGSDDTVMKILVAEALIRTNGEATYDDWAKVWIDHWDDFFGTKVSKFFPSVLHTAAKLRWARNPRMAALGNMASSSSAMCISPVGIVNACNPSQAAAQAYNLASLIHTHDVSFCQDGTAAMAAAVAEAYNPNASVQSIVDCAREAVVPLSGSEMLELINEVIDLALTSNSYKVFRAAVYEREKRFFRVPFCDARETVPIALALFMLAEGNLEDVVTFGANFGRDTDTIATMGGAIAGAFKGVTSIRTDWVQKARKLSDVDQDDLALRLIRTAKTKFENQKCARKLFEKLV